MVYILVAVVVLSVVLLLFFSNKSYIKNAYQEVKEAFESKGDRNLTQEQNITYPIQSEENITNVTNATEPAQPEGAPAHQESESPPKVLTLEIVDICSGKLESVLGISEGVRYCLNKKYPYYIVLEKNQTHIQTSFSDLSGFNETYELNESALIFFVFVEDVASVSKEIQSFYIEGSSDFYLGEYDLHTIWERDANGELYISKIIVGLPLYVKETISPSDEWQELKFYLKTPNKDYYLGNLWFLVKEK
ncbi:MAG: hypothetical protein ACTSV6_02090 [Candidatus Heimdallarchaeota archaeon]